MTTDLTAKAFFEMSGFAHRELFSEREPVWCGLKRLAEYMGDQEYTTIPSGGWRGVPLAETLVLYRGEFLNGEDLRIEYADATKGKLAVFRGANRLEGASVLMAGAVLIGKRIAIGRGVLIEPGALIHSPTVIGDMSEVRQGAYLRGNCLIGSRCVAGHVTEVKNTVFFDDAKAGHFAYLGDTILGNHVNLGAGTKMANLRFVSGNVNVRTAEKTIDTGLRKFGAVLGDQTQTGCNSVTSPGTLIGKKSFLLPNTTAPSGYHPDSSMIR
ncbi:MAG: hypothetical protein KKG47_00750 [Proteobacteria bacterium]|nr:hypothetical protein [Pseudomonadota bacterium]MBU1737268.1 hypothetical protein [Pseudomonadota bacterium]